MDVTFSFELTVERAKSFVEQLKVMHSTVPQPASGSIRSLGFDSYDTKAGEQLNIDLMYLTPDEDIIMAYYMAIVGNTATVIYCGKEEDFGAGDVGPYMGIDKEIIKEARNYSH